LEAKCLEAEAELASAQEQHSKLVRELGAKNESLGNELAFLRQRVEAADVREREQRAQELQKSLVIPEVR
jgi:hypothetical protein